MMAVANEFLRNHNSMESALLRLCRNSSAIPAPPATHQEDQRLYLSKSHPYWEA